jgi:hypothetical protein
MALPIAVIVAYTIDNYDGVVEEGTYPVEKESDGTIDAGYWREKILAEREPLLTYRRDSWGVRSLRLTFSWEEPS